MFDITYFSQHGGFPTGWNEVDEDKTFPNITSRLPVQQQEEEAESGNEFERNDTQPASYSSDEDAPLSVIPRMTDESSDEDIRPAHQRVSGTDFHYSFIPPPMLSFP